MSRRVRRLRNLVISVIYWTAWSALRCVKRILGRDAEPGCMVLCYHTVLPEQFDNFCWQMDELVRLAEPVRPDERNGTRRTRPGAVVTFDDAYAHVLDRVIPEMVARGIPSVVFVPTGYMGRFPGWPIPDHWPERHERVASAKELQNLPCDLVVVGSHTVTHSHPDVLDDAAVEWEYRQSRMKLEQITGRKVTLLAFPYGYMAPFAEACARRAGYERVFSMRPHLARMDRDEFVVGRIRVDPTDWACEFRLKVLGAYCWMPVVSRLKTLVWPRYGAAGDLREGRFFHGQFRGRLKPKGVSPGARFRP